MSNSSRPWQAYRKRELAKSDQIVNRIRDKLLNQSAKHAFLSDQGRREGFYSVWFRHMVEAATLRSAANHMDGLKKAPYFWEND